VDAPQEEVELAVKVAAAQLPTDPELRWKTKIPILEELNAKALGHHVHRFAGSSNLAQSLPLKQTM